MASWPHSHWVAARPRTTVPRRSAACRALRASPAEEASGACKPRARAGCVAKATSCPTWPRSGASNLGATSPARALAATPQTAPSPPRSDLRRAAAAAGRSAAGQPSVPLPGAPQCPTARTLRSSAGPPCGLLAVDGPQPRSRLCRVHDFILDVFDRTTVVLARHRLRAVDDRRRFLQGKLQARRRLGRRRRRIRARLLSLRRPMLARVVDASSASSSTAHDARARRRLSRRGESPQTSTRRIDDDGRRSGGKARETRGEVRR